MSLDPTLPALPQFIGRYRVRSTVGIGGFAVVLRAEDEALRSEVAIKVLGSAGSVDPEIRERFLHEARLLRRVRSPHVIAVHDIGELDDGRPYFVMELATTSLGRRFIPGRAVDPASTRRIVLALSAGLSVLHEAGIFHRDIKPDNLLVLQDQDRETDGEGLDAGAIRTVISTHLVESTDRIAIGDLGLAKDQRLTEWGPTVLGGSARYRAPEQAQLGAEITPSTDVYGATAVLWRMLTGDQPPEPEHVALQLVGLSPQWNHVLSRGLAFDPSDRFPTIAAWREATLELLSEGDEPQPSGTSRRAVTIDGSTCPYKGLASFQIEDGPLFFGRRVLVDELVSRLVRLPVLIIAGSSGSGKSSVLRAGLLAALGNGALPGSQHWRQVLMTPGLDPLPQLYRHLRSVFGDSVPPLHDRNTDLSILEGLASSGPSVVLAIDQFEEFYTLRHGREDVATCMRVLAALTAGVHSKVKVVLAIRADFYSQAAGHPWLADRVNENQVLVTPMRREELREAIERPALRVGLRLEEGLADRIIDDAAGSRGALPLIAHALIETWSKRRGSLLTLNGYEVSGGVAGALAQSADRVFTSLLPEQQQIVRRILLLLVSPSGSPRNSGSASSNRLSGQSHRRMLRTDLGSTASDASVIAALVDARLLTVDGEYVEVAHEALITTWPRLTGWVEDAQVDLVARDRVSSAAAEWEVQSRSPDLLLRGIPLLAAQEWAETQSVIGTLERVFLDEGSRLQAEVQDRLGRSHRRTVSVLSILTAIALLASGAALLGLRKARNNAQLASSSQVLAERRFAQALASSAEQIAPTDPTLAVRLAVEAMVRTEPASVAARRSLVVSRIELSEAALRPDGGEIRVGESLTVAVSPDGELVVAGGFNGMLGLWDTDSHVRISSLVGPKGGIQKARFSPTGSWVVAVDDQGDVWRWDVGSIDRLTTQPGPQSDLQGNRLVDLDTIAWGVAISPDESVVVISTEDGRLVQVASGGGASIDLVRDDRDMAEMGPIDFLSVAFTVDGQRIIAGSGTGLIAVLDRSGKLIHGIGAAHGTSDVWEILPTADGLGVYSAGSDGAARLWSTSDWSLVSELVGESADTQTLLAGAALLPEGGIAIGASDGRLRTWTRPQSAATSGPAIVSGSRHSEAIDDTASDASGRVIATVGDDQQMRIWRYGAPTPVVASMMAHEKPSNPKDMTKFYGIAIDEMTGHVAIGGVGNITVLEPDGKVIAQISAGSKRISSVVWLPDHSLLSGSADGRVARWVAGKLTATTVAHQGAVTDLALSPDGKQLATTGSDRKVHRWDLSASVSSIGARSPGAEMILRDEGHGVAWWNNEIVSVDRSGDIRWWDAAGKEPRSAKRSTGDALWDVAVSADSRFIAVGSANESVLVYDTVEGLDVAPLALTPFRGGALALAWTTEANSLAVTDGDGLVSLWDGPTGQFLGRLGVTGAGGADARGLDVGADGRLWWTTINGSVFRSDVLQEKAACNATSPLDAGQSAKFLAGDRPRACTVTG
jgi:WD40 repeat protein/serine/threonine protein kinase